MKQLELIVYSGGIWVYWNDTPDDVLNRFKKEHYERNT